MTALKPADAIPADTFIAVWTERPKWNGNELVVMSEAYISLEDAANAFFDEADDALDGTVRMLDGTDKTDAAIAHIVKHAEFDAMERHRETGFPLRVNLPAWVERRLSRDETVRLAALEYRHGEAA